MSASDTIGYTSGGRISVVCTSVTCVGISGRFVMIFERPAFRLKRGQLAGDFIIFGKRARIRRSEMRQEVCGRFVEIFSSVFRVGNAFDETACCECAYCRRCVHATYVIDLRTRRWSTVQNDGEDFEAGIPYLATKFARESVFNRLGGDWGDGQCHFGIGTKDTEGGVLAPVCKLLSRSVNLANRAIEQGCQFLF